MCVSTGNMIVNLQSLQCSSIERGGFFNENDSGGLKRRMIERARSVDAMQIPYLLSCREPPLDEMKFKKLTFLSLHCI